MSSLAFLMPFQSLWVRLVLSTGTETRRLRLSIVFVEQRLEPKFQSQSPEFQYFQYLQIGGTAKIGAKVAKESARNEKITKKRLKAKFSAYAYAPRLICKRIAMTWAARPSWNRTLCRVVILCLGYGLKCADDLSCRSRRATNGRNEVSFEAVNATPVPIMGGP
ncbi:hypothetical protein PIB30_096286 [Stylosanthes scabra]|uniref:Uncharacterized protein n=1 Tax=Stylosanthes scabra TaxID=79078 RepID=A0ABU6UYG1_9FABA|nr:hypothetical protein [Stylosanthes scabra]